MKNIASVALVMIMVFAFSSAASADKPLDGQFEIAAQTTYYEYQKLPNGLTSYHLLAEGRATGYLQGQLTFEEWGTIDFDPETQQGSGNGKNHGVMTVTESADRTVLEFNGEIIGLQSVLGKFKVIQQAGSGANGELDGHGDYTGTGGSPFTVALNGQFHSAD